MSGIGGEGEDTEGGRGASMMCSVLSGGVSGVRGGIRWTQRRVLPPLPWMEYLPPLPFRLGLLPSPSSSVCFVLAFVSQQPRGVWRRRRSRRSRGNFFASWEAEASGQRRRRRRRRRTPPLPRRLSLTSGLRLVKSLARVCCSSYDLSIVFYYTLGRSLATSWAFT